MAKPPKRGTPKYADSELDTYRYSEPTFTMEWTDGQGIFAIYSDGITERHIRDFADKLIEHLKRPSN